MAPTKPLFQEVYVQEYAEDPKTHGGKHHTNSYYKNKKILTGRKNSKKETLKEIR